MIGALLAGTHAGVPVLGDFESIATVTVGSGGAADIEFTSIPGTYQHLQIRAIARTTLTDNALSPIVLQFNGVTSTASYRTHQLVGNGTAANSYDVSSWGGAGAGGVLNSSTGSAYSVIVVDILDYANANKNTTTRTLYGGDYNGGGDVGMWSGLFINTGAITSIKTSFPQGRTLGQYSHFALYGIKG